VEETKVSAIPLFNFPTTMVDTSKFTGRGEANNLYADVILKGSEVRLSLSLHSRTSKELSVGTFVDTLF